MKTIFNYKVTDKAAEQIEKELGKSIDAVSMEDLLEIVKDFFMDNEEEYIWTEDEIHYICSLEFGDSRCNGCCNSFYEVRELGIYIAEDSNNNALYNNGQIGDTTIFIDNYLTYYTGESKYIMESIYNISWDDEESECKKAVDELIAEYEDTDGQDTIEFSGINKNTCLVNEIKKHIGSNDEDFDCVEGYYLGKEIYNINDKLYYLTDDSWSMNEEYNWKLQEVSKKCYDYFDI